MVLVDTSVWVDHLRSGDEVLKKLLRDGAVIIHPFVIGELACGTIHQRSKVLGLLSSLPGALSADHAEVLNFITDQRLYGLGLGYIDVHLLAAALLNRIYLWTRDKRLHSAAEDFNISFDWL